jgi:LPS export ABC transporter protein LptC
MKLCLFAALVCAVSCGSRLQSPVESRTQTIESLTLSQSENGQPAWSLRSHQASLHEDEKIATLDRPTMEFYRDARVISQVTAVTGEVQTETHDVKLSSSVVLDSMDDHSRLTTDTLMYSSKRSKFYTHSPVMVRRPDGIIRGEGMEASPDLSEIHIFRQRSELKNKLQ